MRFWIWWGLLLNFYFPMTWAETPQVVVTLKPLHALVSGVMEGVNTPHLLLSGGESPHTYTLKPSQVKILHQAQLVVWVGTAIESFLVKPLQTLPQTVRAFSILEIKQLYLHPARRGGVWEDEHHETQEHGIDQHVWLDPRNAQLIVQAVAQQLQHIDPENQLKYIENANRLTARLDALDHQLQQQLHHAKNIALMVFHDAYQYFESRYGLSVVGSISISPENRPSAKRLHQLRERIQSAKVRCIFSEPQFESTLIDTLTEGLNIKQGTLDPNGMELHAGREAYFGLLMNLAKSVRSCAENAS